MMHEASKSTPSFAMPTTVSSCAHSAYEAWHSPTGQTLACMPFFDKSSNTLDTVDRPWVLSLHVIIHILLYQNLHF